MTGGLAGPDHCPSEATGPAAVCCFFPHTVTNTSEPDSTLSYRGRESWSFWSQKSSGGDRPASGGGAGGSAEVRSAGSGLTPAGLT